MDVLAMQNLCAYEVTSLGGSSFCSLFTEQEWKDFSYNVDVQYYGDYAYGSPTGRAQGIGYVLELAARLQQKLITSSDTSINYTYDDNTAQFPFGQPFYLDMSHDDIILSVISALGLDYFKYGPKGLPGDVDHAPSKRTFSLSEMTPFGARFFSEIWTCPRDTSFDDWTQFSMRTLFWILLLILRTTFASSSTTHLFLWMALLAVRRLRTGSAQSRSS